MATEFYYKDSVGFWRKAKELWYKDSGGTWRMAKELWYKDSVGTWRRVFSSVFTVNAALSLTTYLFGAPNPRVEMRSNGDVYGYPNFVPLVLLGAWGTPATTGAGANYWVRAALGAGTGTIASGTIGSFTNLASDQVWELTAAPSGQYRDRSLTIDISTDSSGTPIVGGGSLRLTSDRI